MSRSRARGRLSCFHHEVTKSSADETDYAVAELGDVEIEDEARAEARQLEVREELCAVDSFDLPYALHFDDELSFDQEVDSVRGVDLMTPEPEWHDDLALHL